MNEKSSGSILKDPVCGMEVDPGSPFKVTYEGQDYAFCSQHCLDEFQRAPSKFLMPLFFLDPVCGMSVKTTSEFKTLYKGNEYIFCSWHCLAEFQENPEKYIGAPVEYFKCPVHPRLRQVEPGICPQCGMPSVAVKTKWVCPYHPEMLQDEPGVCPIYGLPLIPEPPGRFYFCEIHPEVEQFEPGRCPKCGMELLPSWAPVALLKVAWYCPKHPDAVSPTPGMCSKCGLKMEPRLVPVKKADEPTEEEDPGIISESNLDR
jgi:YHS domain-containing protein